MSAASEDIFSPHEILIKILQALPQLQAEYFTRVL